MLPHVKIGSPLHLVNRSARHHRLDESSQALERCRELYKATVQERRDALALYGGKVYIAFGGLYGNCGNYQGMVVTSRTDGTRLLLYVFNAVILLLRCDQHEYCVDLVSL